MKKLFLILVVLLGAYLPLSAITLAVDGIVYVVNEDCVSVSVQGPADPQIVSAIIPETITYTFPPAASTEVIRSRAGGIPPEDDIFPKPNTTYTFTVTGILDQGFAGLANLKSIRLPETIKTMGYEAFDRCTSLESIKIPAQVTKLLFVCNSCTALKEVTIPASVKSVSLSFEQCGDMERVIIEDTAEPMEINDFLTGTNVNSIYQGRTMNGEFYQFSVKKLTLGDLVKEIEENQYSQGTIEELDLGNGVQIIGQDVFRDCTNLRNVTLPESLVEIGRYAFTACKALESVHIPSKITELSDVFNECSSLKEVVIPANVKMLEGPFSFCGVIENLVLEDGDDFLDGNAFWQTEIRNIYQGRTTNCNLNYHGVQKVTISDFVTEIHDGMYSGNPLTELSIGKNVTKIGNAAFIMLSELRSVVLPESLVELGQNFNQCDALETINIPSKLRHLSVFCNYCPSLKEITIPATVESIDNAFQDLPGLKRVIIEDSPKQLDLQSYVLSADTLDFMYVGRDIPHKSGSMKVDSLIIGDQVTNLTTYNFEHKDIRYLEIGSSVESIGQSAFTGSDKISKIQVRRQDPSVCEDLNVFDRDVYDNAMLFVPREARNKYMSAPVWKEFKHIYQDSYTIKFVYDTNQVELALPNTFSGLVAYGEGVTFTSAVLESYRLGNVTFDGEYEAAEQGADGSWTLSGVRSDITVNIHSEEIYFSVKASIDAAGSISLNGETTDSIYVRYGQPLTAGVALNEGFEIASVVVNGNPLTVPVESNSFTINRVLNNLEISVATNPKSYTFNIKYDDALGSVTLDGNTATKQNFTFGSRPVIEVLPDEGYAISKATLNGRDITAMFTDNTYRVDSIKADMQLTVEFEARTVGLSILGLQGGRITTLNPYGAQVCLLITADEGWTVNTIAYNGNVVDAADYADGYFSTPALTDNAEISVSFVREISSVDDINSDSAIRVYGSGRTIHIECADSESIANICDEVGRVIYTGTDRRVTVPQSGIYIVSLGNRTFKLML